jgi:hypothetical protein
VSTEDKAAAAFGAAAAAGAEDVKPTESAPLPAKGSREELAGLAQALLDRQGIATPEAAALAAALAPLPEPFALYNESRAAFVSCGLGVVGGTDADLLDQAATLLSTLSGERVVVRSLSELPTVAARIIGT